MVGVWDVKLSYVPLAHPETRSTLSLGSPGWGSVTISPNTRMAFIIELQPSFIGEVNRVAIADTNKVILDTTIKATNNLVRDIVSTPFFEQSRYDVGYSIAVVGGGQGAEPYLLQPSFSFFGIQLHPGAVTSETAPFSKGWSGMIYDPGKVPYTQAELDDIDRMRKELYPTYPGPSPFIPVPGEGGGGEVPAPDVKPPIIPDFDFSKVPEQIAGAMLKALTLLSPLSPYIIIGLLALGAIAIVPGVIRGAFKGD